MYITNSIYSPIKNNATINHSRPIKKCNLEHVISKGSVGNVPFAKIPNYHSINFTGNITPQAKKACNAIINGTSLSCAGVSAALGEGAATGADTAIVRGLQGIMMLGLQKVLKVPPGPSALYTAKEMFSGAVIGTEGVKFVTAVTGIGAHAISAGSGASVASGGSTHAGITKAVRGINATLSAAITKKMGHGYIKRVKQDRMNWKDQGKEAGTVLAGHVLWGEDFGNIFKPEAAGTLADVHDPKLIQEALNNIPKETKSLYGHFLGAINDLNLQRTGGMFAIDFGQKIIFKMKKNKLSKLEAKNDFKESLKKSLVSTAIYDMFDFAMDSSITKEAQKTLEEMNSNMHEYPEVHNTLKEIENKFIHKTNLESLDTEEFTSQFKNKSFVLELSLMGEDAAKELSDAWKFRNILKMKKQQEKDLKLYRQEIEKEANLNNKEFLINKDLLRIEAENDAKDLHRDLSDTVKDLKISNAIAEVKNKKGFEKISGYEKEKEFIKEKLINPIKEGSDISRAILLYGPTGNGKTTLVKAIAEQANFHYDKVKMTGFNKGKVVENLIDAAKSSQERFNQDGKRTIILLDEFDALGANDSDDINKATVNILKDYSEKFKCVFVMTTNNPLKIKKNILDEDVIPLRLPMGAPTQNDKVDILKHYFKSDNFNYPKISEVMSKKQVEGKYSAAQIEKIWEDSLKFEEIEEADIVGLIKSEEPEISNRSLEKFRREKEELGDV